jgi:hypothetical protein
MCLSRVSVFIHLDSRERSPRICRGGFGNDQAVPSKVSDYDVLEIGRRAKEEDENLSERENN